MADDMKNPFAYLNALQGKKRYIVMAIIGAELLALPAAAQIVHKVAFEVRPMVTAVEIPTAEPGHSRFIVTSNAGFGIDAVNMVGDVKIRVYQSGKIQDGPRFGDNAQLPGDKSVCAESYSAEGSPIYLATQKTAATPGDPVSQSVIFEMRYDADAEPDFKFRAGTRATLPPMMCSDLKI